MNYHSYSQKYSGTFFYNLHSNEVNFHDMRRLTVTTPQFHQVSKLHVIMEYSFQFQIVQICESDKKCESYNRKYSRTFLWSTVYF